MPTFTPSGTLYIGRVGFDNSYRYTYKNFTTKAAQYSYFYGKCVRAFDDSTYTYIRKDGVVRVKANAETLYGMNYCMYQNANHGSKWFYCFITNVEYINENTTELTLETDVLQTWLFDIDITACYVEREHVYDDSLYKWLNAEPEMPANLKCNYKEEYEDFEPRAVIVQSTEKPHVYNILGQDKAIGGDPIPSKVVNGVFNGSGMTAFVLEYDAVTQHYSSAALQGFLSRMNEAGIADSVSNIFEFPVKFIPDIVATNYDAQELDDSAKPVAVQKQFARPTNLDGYTPRNNKLFTYPYSFVRIEDNNGHQTEWKWELWRDNVDGGTRTPTYWVWVPVDPDACAFVIPTVYNGEAANFENALSFPVTAKCSWTYSAYENWSAQNWLGNLLSAATAVGMIALPATRGISAFVDGAEQLALGDIAATATKSIEHYKQAGTFFQRAEKAKTAAGIGVGMAGMTASTVSAHMMQPNVTKGSAGGNSLFGIGKQTYNIKRMSFQAEFAAIADSFFDVYGYAIEQVKVPDIDGRPYWNYVKTGNAQFEGNVPAGDLATINAIFNRGVTFWHTDSIGDYSLDNRAVVR